jgi:hypothetical protein
MKSRADLLNEVFQIPWIELPVKYPNFSPGFPNTNPNEVSSLVYSRLTEFYPSLALVSEECRTAVKACIYRAVIMVNSAGEISSQNPTTNSPKFLHFATAFQSYFILSELKAGDREYELFEQVHFDFAEASVLDPSVTSCSTRKSKMSSIVADKAKQGLRSDLDKCFSEFNQSTTQRIAFADRVLNILVKYTREPLDRDIVYESVAGSDKTSLGFIGSLIGGLAMTGRNELALNVAKKVISSFPELAKTEVYH